MNSRHRDEVALTASAPWVTAPASMVLLSAGAREQSFTVKLNPDGLPAGATLLASTPTPPTRRGASSSPSRYRRCPEAAPPW